MITAFTYLQRLPKVYLSTLLLTTPIFLRTPQRGKTLCMLQRWPSFRDKQWTHLSKLTLDVSKDPNSKSLPTSSIPETQMMQCHVPSNAQPKCPRYDSLDTNPSTDITDAATQDELAWSLVQSLARSRSEDPKMPTWTAYNSKVSSSTLPLTTVAMMPLLAAPAHEWSTVLTVLK